MLYPHILCIYTLLVYMSMRVLVCVHKFNAATANIWERVDGVGEDLEKRHPQRNVYMILKIPSNRWTWIVEYIMGGKTFEKLFLGVVVCLGGDRYQLATIDTMPLYHSTLYIVRNAYPTHSIESRWRWGRGGTTVFMFRSGIVRFNSEILLKYL